MSTPTPATPFSGRGSLPACPRGQGYSYGRGRGRGRAGAFTPALRTARFFAGGVTDHDARAPPPIPDDLGDVLKALRVGDIEPVAPGLAVVSGVRVVGSYNWIGGVEKPVVALPGALPKWTPPKTPPKLQQDSGTYFRDVNAAFSPQHGMHAAALSVLRSAQIAPGSVDLFACGGTLRALFEFVAGKTKTLRIAAEAVGDTVFLVRRGADPREVLDTVYGYGHAMPEAYTTWDPSVRGSVSGQRVIRYQFAGLTCLVRYEPDGYLPEHAPGVEDAVIGRPDDGDEDLAALIERTAVSSRVELETSGPRAELRIKRAGYAIPQNATFELKTRSQKNTDNLFTQFAPSLWLKQTPFFITAFHEWGVFRDIRIHNVTAEVAQWQAENQMLIRRFGGLLRWIVDFVRAADGGVVELWRHEDGQLTVRSPSGSFEGALPIDVEDQWIEGGRSATGRR